MAVSISLASRRTQSYIDFNAAGFGPQLDFDTFDTVGGFSSSRPTGSRISGVSRFFSKSAKLGLSRALARHASNEGVSGRLPRIVAHEASSFKVAFSRRTSRSQMLRAERRSTEGSLQA